MIWRNDTSMISFQGKRADLGSLEVTFLVMWLNLQKLSMAGLLSLRANDIIWSFFHENIVATNSGYPTEPLFHVKL